MRVDPLLTDAVGMFQDRGRDDVPPGHAWALKDVVPQIAGAALRGRGSWDYVSQAFLTAPRGLIYAPYVLGGKLLAVTETQIYDVPVSGPTATLVGTVSVAPDKQNPIFYRNKVYIPLHVAATAVVTYDGAFVFTVSALPASAMWARHATSYRDRLVLARGPNASGAGALDAFRVSFSKPGDPSLAWDALSYVDTSDVISGVWAMRNQILVFHSTYVEQIRGTTPPDSTLTDPTGDMSLGVMWDKAGCLDARSIAGWQGNAIFADERGVHITDGGLVRNMIEQGGMSRLWRLQFETEIISTISATVFGNFYVCTVRGSSNTWTWICDIPTRNWFRWTNIDAQALAVSSGTVERLYGTNTSQKRVISMENCFKPSLNAQMLDANVVAAYPEVETAWVRLSKRAGWRRIHDLIVHFLAWQPSDPGTDLVQVSYIDTPEDTSYTLLGGLRQAVLTTPRKIRVGGRFQGIALKIAVVATVIDFRLHEIGMSVEPEEEHRI